MSLRIPIRRVHWLVLCAGAFLALAIPGAVAAPHPHPPGAREDRLPDFDQRLTPDSLAARAARQVDPARNTAEGALSLRVPQLRITRDELHDSPRWIMSRDGFLSGPDGRGRGVSETSRRAQRDDDPHRAVKAFINEHAPIFGHSAAALDEARVERDSTSPGLRTVIWQQLLDGIPVCDATFVAHTSGQGELVSVASHFLAAPSRARRGDPARAMPVERAFALAAVNIGESAAAAAQVTVLEIPTGPSQRQKLQSPSLRHEATAQLVWLAFSPESLRLAWEVWLTGMTHGDGYHVLVDAATGEILRRHSLTVDASPASFRVFTSDSPRPLSPGLAEPGVLVNIATAARSLQTLTSLSATASPSGWVTDGTNTLRGNNASAFRIAWVPSGNGHSGSSVSVTGNPFRVFDRPFISYILPPEDLYVEGSNDKAAMVNLFYWCNWMHDKLYPLGFTETAGNYQLDNFGRGGLGGDAIFAEAQDASNPNNASFTPAPDGSAGRISMGRWMGSGGRRDSAFDAEIILHEYAHGLSQRLVGDGSGALSASQSRGLGEGWSDFYALSLLSQSGDALNGNYAKGAYATAVYYRDGAGWGFDSRDDSYYFGIRRYPYTTNLAKNPLTLKDIDPTKADRHLEVPTSPLWAGLRADEVHAQGEVWCVTLWEARSRFIQSYGFTSGNQKVLELVTAGMKLTPDLPDFLEARDAILTADSLLNTGANRGLLWAAFARRGMGWHASTPVSSNTVGVIENFDVPDSFSVLPAAGLTLRGPVGGPFPFSGKVYSLHNVSNAVALWSARAESPLLVSPASGTLAVLNQSQDVVVTLNHQLASQLPAGIYQPVVTFSNRVTGIVVRRPFRLLVGVDFYTEEFKNSPATKFDLANTSLTFTRNPEDNSYSLCQTPAGGFPIDPAGGQFLDEGEECRLVPLGPGRQITYFSGIHQEVTIHRHGSVVLGDVCGLFNNLSGHFTYPRVSPFLRTQYPIGSNAVSWLDLNDRLVVTWQGMRTYDPSGTNSYQVELFHNGNVRMTWRNMTTANAVVGLSRGTEQAVDFAALDLSDARGCSTLLDMTVPAEAREGDGIRINAGRVAVPQTRASPLLVSLFSANTNKVTVPASVTIPAGDALARFDITIVDRALLDGSQSALITASAGGFTDAFDSILVHDNESVPITLTTGATLSEGQVMSGTVSVPVPVDDDVVVRLASSRPQDLGFFSVLAFIPKGQSTGDFLLAAFDDQAIDGPVQVTLSATVSNWITGLTLVTVLDNERTNLFIRGIDQLSEGSGLVPNGGRVFISGTVTSNVLVTLWSGDTTELLVPPSVVIPAGSTNAFFDITYVDDDLLGESPLVTIHVSAPGFGTQFDPVFVLDNDGPVEPFDPRPADQAVNVPRDTDLAWGRADGDLIVNGSFTDGLASWTREDFGAGGWGINDGSLDPESSDGPLPPRDATGPSALSRQSGNGRHALYQDFRVPPNASTVTLSWGDRIRNHAGQFSASQQFRVELRNPLNNAVLAVLYRTLPGDALFQDWTERTLSLNPWRGKDVRLAFVDEDGEGYLNVHLDDVRVVAVGAAQTLYEVYFGTTNELGAAHLLGTTTNTSWSLTTLPPEVTYFWKILARRGAYLGVGPVWEFTTGGQSNQIALIASNATWRYVANGVYPGATWTDSGYDDRNWLQGAAKLGYGADGENTVIGTSANSHITYWFRHQFTVANLPNILSLTARLIRDDGAAVYLRDSVVWRDNLPRVFDQNTPAIAILNAPEEREWITWALTLNRLVPGQNTIAVEVHQRHGTLANSPDLGFAFELIAQVDEANPPPSVTWTAPTPFEIRGAPVSLPLAVVVTDLDANGSSAAVNKVEFFANGSKLGEDVSAPFAFTWAATPIGEHALRAIATDAGGLRATSDVRYVTITSPLPTLNLIPSGSTWLYNDADIDLGTNWVSPKFSDREWRQGPAQLGFGDGDEATVLRSGRDAHDRPITTYFRHKFQSLASLTNFALRVVRDDGVIVYLDGSEVFRNNMPAGAVSHGTLASSDLSGAAENAFLSATINVPLSVGTHVIAAEVHQSSGSSSDLSFDLELTGVGNPLPQVAMISPAPGVIPVPPALQLVASASDPYGAVNAVQFLRNGIFLGSAGAPPWQFTWLNPPAGLHTLVAVATDNSGASRTSAPVVLTLASPVPLTVVRENENAILSWPDSAPGFHVETTTNLADASSWLPLNIPVTQAGGRFQVTVAITESQRYFRLRAP